jgi:phosphoglycerol transferase MdoB-like AlkP superfamily enzyme
MRRLLGTRYRALVLLLGGLFTVSALTRVATLVLLAHGDGVGSAAGAARAFAAGAVYDALVALWLAAPLVLWLTLGRHRGWTRPRRAGTLAALLGAYAALGVFTAVAEALFFDEFTGRFNFVAVDYLVYPTEVMTNLGESYPVPAILAAVGAVAVLAWWLARRALRPVVAEPAPARARWTLLGTYAALLAALTLGVSSDLARVSDDRALNEVAANGYYTFWQALRGQDAPYVGLYATRPDPEVFSLLHHALAERASADAPFAPRSTLRHVRGLEPERRLNVVLVLEESLGSQFVGALHPDGAAITPHLDSLAAEGTLLTHVYSTGNRTIRALEATTSALPPLPGVSIVRRDASTDLFTLPALLRARGYATEFVYGGRALFDNMGAYMRANGMERVAEQSDYRPGLFHTAWGVADEAIFDMALHQADSLHATGRPFLLQVLTVSNHKPYTYPAGRIAADPAQRRRENAVRYADWALGRFVRDARRHAWFDHTVFVLMGDHGARVYGASEIPLPSYEVPVVLYGPGLVGAGRRVSTLASSLDVPPTVLGLLGASYDSKFFGRDVLNEDPAAGRALMTHNNEIALMRGSEVAVLGLRGATRLYRYDAARGALVPDDRPDAAGHALVEEAIAYYDGADRLYRSGAYRLETAEKAVGVARTGGVRGGTGSSSRKVVPPGPISSRTSRPPWASAIQRAIGSPSPALAASPRPGRREVPRVVAVVSRPSR